MQPNNSLNNHLRSINIEEFSCLEAESINLSSNAFKTFPKELSKFSNLKTIDLSNNPIKSLGGKYNFYGFYARIMGPSISRLRSHWSGLAWELTN